MQSIRELVIAALCVSAGLAVGTYRERATLLPRIECAYHEGLDEGFDTGANDAAATQRIMETHKRIETSARKHETEQTRER